MLITKLRGINVRQYPEINIEFKTGLININGVNGSGKTTIMTLVELALFGSITGSDGKKMLSSEIKYDQAKKSQKWEVELTFEKDGNEYTVYRHETTAKAKLSVNGKALITGGQTEVTNHIVQKVLRMDQVSFCNAFYARQDDFDNLIKLSPEKRKKEISRLLRIDKLDETIQAIRKDKNQLVTVIDEHNRHIKDNEYFVGIEQELTSSLSVVKETQKQQEENVKEKESAYKSLLEQKSILDSKYEKYQELSSTYREKNQEQKHLTEMTLNNIQSELKDIQNSKQEFSDLQVDVEKYDSLLIKLQQMQQTQVLFVQKKQLEQHMLTLKNRLTSKKERMDNLKASIPTIDFLQKIKSTDEEISKLDDFISNINNEIVDLKSDLTYVTNEGKRLKNERNSIHQLGEESPCPVCKRSMGEHFHTLSNEYGVNLEELASKHNKLTTSIKQKENQKLESQSKISSLKQQKGQFENEQRQVVKLQDEFKMLQQDFQNDKKDYLNVEQQLDNLKDIDFDEIEFKKLSDEVNTLQKKKERFNFLSSMIAKEPKLLSQEKDIELKIKTLLNELKTIQDEVKNINFNMDEYRSFQNKINVEVDSLRNAEKELSFTKEQKNNIELRIEHLEKERKENEGKIKELELRKRELALLIKAEEINKGYKIKRMSKARPRIEKIMQELLSFITDGKYDLVVLDEHYNVFVYRNGVKKPFHLFSGGEQKLIALCMRLAISRILTSQGEHKNFDYLALDEVLGSMDEGRQETIIDALRRLTSVFKQIFMITHNNNIKDLFDHTLQVEQNLDLSSRAYWTTETDDDLSDDYPIAN